MRKVSSEAVKVLESYVFHPLLQFPLQEPITIGAARGPCPPKFLEYLVILCLERQYPKQNTVARLKSNILSPPTFGWL